MGIFSWDVKKNGEINIVCLVCKVDEDCFVKVLE